MNITKIKNRLFLDSPYARNFLVMARGRIVGQMIPILLVPFLTRLYLPEEFGVFAIFVTVTAILSLISTGRYNLAIILPKKDEEVFNLFMLCVIINFLFCILIFILILFFAPYFSKILNLQSHLSVLYLIPLGTFLLGIGETLHFLSLRKRVFTTIANNMIVQFSLISILKISFAFVGIGSLGLIWGHTIGYFGGILLLLFMLSKKNVFVGFKNIVSKQLMLKLALEYKKFPLYSSSGSILNSLSVQMPNLLLNNFFGSTILGYYSLTQRVLGLPVNLVSGAITDVFREKAAADFRETGSCRNVFIRTFKLLFVFSIFPFLLMFVFAPTLVPFILGETWAPVGVYLRIMLPLFFITFSVVPVSSILYITGKQGYKLVWEILTFIVIVVSFYIGFKFFNQYFTIALYTFSLSFMYIILLIMSYRFSEKSNEKT